MAETVWVLVNDRGYDGYGAPVVAWMTKPTGEQLARWFDKKYGQTPDSVYLNKILDNVSLDWFLKNINIEE